VVVYSGGWSCILGCINLGQWSSPDLRTCRLELDIGGCGNVTVVRSRCDIAFAAYLGGMIGVERV
jgi:hypothetical protein